MLKCCKKSSSNIMKSGMYVLCPVMVLLGCAGSPGKNAHAVHVVTIAQMKFQPAELIANKGDTVIFINNDIVAHDITADEDKTWTSSSLENGKSWKTIIMQSA